MKIKPGEKMHSDICGPMSMNSVGGLRYFLTFKDGVTGYRLLYSTKKKSEVYEKFTQRKHNANVADYIEMMTYEEATNSTEAAQWVVAIQNEFKAHEKNNTWKLVKRTLEMRLIDSKWVFRITEDADEKSHPFKVRLSARGFLQREGIDFKETFFLVLMYDSLRVFLATIAARHLKVMNAV